MAGKKQHEFDLQGRVSFRLPVAIHKAIQAQANTEQKTVSDILREETMQIFKQKTV